MAVIWRYIPPLALSGAQQMAIDTWLWQHYCDQANLSCLRFYTWEPAALSYGYHQTPPGQWQSLTWDGEPLPLIKRPTGGRAVLHTGDLTYALITPLQARSRRLAYEQLSQFLIAGFQALGISIKLGRGDRPYQRDVNCFGSVTTADLTLENGYKLIGSAQAWKGLTVLQHGSIQLQPQPKLWRQVFQTELELPQMALPDAPTLIDALTRAAESCFAIKLQAMPLTPNEWSEIEPLAQHIERGELTLTGELA